MIDLTEAGRRLASTRVGPTPSLDKLQATRKRRRQRRLIIAAGSVMSAAAVAAVVTFAVASTGSRPQPVETGPSPSRPTSITTLPATHSVAGSTPYDYQRLRLWLPTGWTTSTNNCHMATQVVYFPANYSGGPETSCTRNGANIVVVLAFNGAPPRSPTATTVNGVTVGVVHGPGGAATWYVPSLQAELVLSGNLAQKVADTLEASPLQDVLTGTFPTPVPTAWRTVTFDGFQAKVPPGWPTHRIVINRVGNSTEVSVFPGVCAPPLFGTPSVYLGSNPGVFCPFIPETKQPPTDDGLWLQPSTNTAPLASQLQAGAGNSSTLQRLTTIGPDQVLITAGQGDSIQVEIDSAGRRIAAVIGLGPNPAVAEAILSSIVPTNG